MFLDDTQLFNKSDWSALKITIDTNSVAREAYSICILNKEDRKKVPIICKRYPRYLKST